MSKTLHAGWFRCRIRGLSRSNYPWIYFHVTIQGSQRELRREGRYLAGLYLHRQIFDFESVHAPDDISPLKTINDTVFYRRNSIAGIPLINEATQ